MKKILFAVPMLAMALTVLTSCDPSHDDEDSAKAVSSEQLTSEVQVTAKSEGNNNLTVFTTPTRYIKVYDAENDAMVGSGTLVNIQVVPPTTEFSFYVVTAGTDGNVSIKSNNKSILITEYTDLPEIYNIVFGDGNGGFTAHTWVWDTEASDGVWGNGAYLENNGPGWWVVSAADIDEQAAGKNLPNDGLNGWMTLALNGVKTSRGESGQIKVTEEKVKEGWDIGRMVFTGTTPLMGIQPNAGGNQYDYHILKASDTNLRLCAPEPGSGDWGTAWFWNFKRDDSAAK